MIFSLADNSTGGGNMRSKITLATAGALAGLNGDFISEDDFKPFMDSLPKTSK